MKQLQQVLYGAQLWKFGLLLLTLSAFSIASLFLFLLRGDLHPFITSFLLQYRPPSSSSSGTSCSSRDPQSFVQVPPPPHHTIVNASSWAGLTPPPQITVQHLFSNLTPTLYPSTFPPLHPHNHSSLLHLTAPFTSSFLPNPNKYESVALRHACIEPHHGGRLLLVGVSEDDLAANFSSKSGIPSLGYLWHRIYRRCGNQSTLDCVGVRFAPYLPSNARWIPGNTLHFVAYGNRNTIHNFAERIWPRLAMSVSPLNETTEGLPVHHFIVHRLDTFLKEAGPFNDRDQWLVCCSIV